MLIKQNNICCVSLINHRKRSRRWLVQYSVNLVVVVLTTAVVEIVVQGCRNGECFTGLPDQYQLKFTSPPEFLLVRQPIEHYIHIFNNIITLTLNDHPLKTKRINIYFLL